MKRKLQCHVLNKYRCKDSQQDTSKSSLNVIKKDHASQSSGFLSQKCKGGSTSTDQKNIINHLNSMKDKNQMAFSLEAETAFDKIQHALMTKPVQKLHIEATIPKIRKAVHHKLKTINLVGNCTKNCN